MALFSSDKKEKAVVEAKATATPAVPQGHAWVLRNPRITEKATDVGAGSVYVFDVSPRAGKQQIKEAVSALYKVSPVKINIVNTKPKMKRNMRTGKYGMTASGKKAYVYLKKGETISII